MVSQEEMEDLYGPLASHSEHKVGDRIRYIYEGQATAGTIVWVCAARPDSDPPLKLCYVVNPDVFAGMPHITYPNDILTAE